jgi:FkbM family methyltransferase
MNLISRTVLFLKRRVRSRIYGISFRGTSTPDSLAALRISGKVRTVLLPDNSGHWHDFINIFLDDEYGLQKLATAPKTILDLGGNVGLFSLYARDCFGDARIHCYEPNPELIPFLQANLEGLDIQIHEKAVGIKAGSCTMETTSDNRCSAISAGEGDIEIEGFESVIARFDSRIDLLKIDIEGGEWPLLFETDSLTFQKVNRIVMEYHDTESRAFADLVNASERLGFLIDHHSKNAGFGIVWLSRVSPSPS